jgi:hypothetical protein
LSAVLVLRVILIQAKNQEKYAGLRDSSLVF